MSKGRYLVNKLKDGTAISNETITLHNLNWNDAGNYTLEFINSEGLPAGKWILQLMIQAPVSYVWMTSQCLSQGETKVSCHSLGGDSLFQYSWSLNGVPHVSSENDLPMVTLKQGESGYVVCNVSNYVSTASAGQTISECVFVNCTLNNGTDISNWFPRGAEEMCYKTTTSTSSTGGKEPGTTESNKPSTNITTSSQTTSNTTDGPWYITHLSTMVGVLSALLILLVLAIAFVCVHKKRHVNKGQGSMQMKDDQELTYADVNILKGRKVPQKTEEDVEYGQIKISRRPRQIAEPKEDECVYAKVRGPR
ncbi:uncharacterized protein LOC142892734 isoform X2 [Nelusetta ayraudi]|uniref:uncharacterized protein LOC142892734 isoform X2 n=1 Tax=Nelusetta ayraudi TaxID=303726 RepID=UPI003F724EAA